MNGAGPVTIIGVERRFAAVVRQEVGYAEMANAQRRARKVLDARLRDAGIAPAGPALTVWRPLGAGLVDYAPGVFVATPVAGMGEVSLLTLPAGRAAHLRLSGSYENLPAAWERLFAGCEGHALAGLNWEVYTTPGAGPDAAETDLFALLA